MRPSIRLLNSVVINTTSTSAKRSTTIGFIGLGRMGFEMATNLFTKSVLAYKQTGSSSSSLEIPVNPKDADKSTLSSARSRGPAPAFVVCDVNEDASRALVRNMSEKFPDFEFRIARDPAEVVTLSSTLITMLPSSPQVKAVYLDSNSAIVPAFTKVPQGEPTLVIDSTTLDIDVARDVAKQVEQAGGMMVDAPVSGGVSGARAGTLSFMVGGPQPSVTLAKSYLSLMGARTIHCGASGSGLAAKICNNMILGVQQIAVAEGMLLGQRMGLEPDVLAGVLNTSTGRCWSSEVNNPVPGALPQSTAPCTRDYEGGFATALMLKDMNLAIHAAHAFTSPLILGSTAKEVYENVAKKSELAQKDFSVVYEVFRLAAEAQASKKAASS